METMTSNERVQFRAMSQGINLSEIRTRLPQLEALCMRKIEAAEEFKNAIQVAALEAGLIPAVLSQFVSARCTDSVSKKAQSAEQLSLLFGEEIAAQ
jgi:hypothetical protein